MLNAANLILSTEACPFCRRVREAITELDLSVEVSKVNNDSFILSGLYLIWFSCQYLSASLQVYPCPKGSVRHREMVRRFGGKEQYVIHSLQVMLRCSLG